MGAAAVTWRNPWPRTALGEDGRFWTWWSSPEVARCHQSIRSLLRIRAAARHSCARLRRERDEARAMSERSSALLRESARLHVEGMGLIVESDVAMDEARAQRDEAIMSAARCVAEHESALRELAARRAVDEFLKENDRWAIDYRHGSLRAVEYDDDGMYRSVVRAPDYPALADALGLDWEKTNG